MKVETTSKEQSEIIRRKERESILANLFNMTGNGMTPNQPSETTSSKKITLRYLFIKIIKERSIT